MVKFFSKYKVTKLSKLLIESACMSAIRIALTSLVHNVSIKPQDESKLRPSAKATSTQMT